MNKNYFAPGANYYDHHKDITINVNGANPADLLRAALAEDITPEVVSDETEKTPDGKRLFCRITKAAYDKGVAQQVEDNLRSASVSAPKLVKTLNTNDALGYTDTKNLSSTDLYDLLNEHYGLSFKKHHFTVCRSKIATDFY